MSYTGNYASNTTGQPTSDLKENRFERVADSVEQTMSNVAAQGREAGEQVQIVAENFRTALDKSLRDQPLTTLAVTAALGFVIGALWKS
jgi:ElaB/YqjD/DUF883 family membrane-anchored ribosome-binding protein